MMISTVQPIKTNMLEVVLVQSGGFVNPSGGEVELLQPGPLVSEVIMLLSSWSARHVPGQMQVDSKRLSRHPCFPKAA